MAEAIQKFNEQVSQLRKTLKATRVESRLYTAAEVFVHIFSETFANDIPGYVESSEFVQLITRSNWTYHTAFSIKKTAQIMYLNCVFETQGRLDGVIQTYEDEPKIILMAEWEWECQSVFGKEKELEKLWNGTSNVKNANAFLITYCADSEYQEFVRKVVEYWQGKDSTRKRNYPILYLTTAIISLDEKSVVVK